MIDEIVKPTARLKYLQDIRNVLQIKQRDCKLLSRGKPFMRSSSDFKRYSNVNWRGVPHNRVMMCQGGEMPERYK